MSENQEVDEQDGLFADTPDELWTYRRMVNWKECPHLLTPRKLKQRENLIRTFGEDNPWIQSMLYGRFQRADTINLVFSRDHIEAIKRAMHGNPDAHKGRPKASIDFSGGKDAQALMEARGGDIHTVTDFHESDEIALASKLVTFFRAKGIQPFDVIVDGGGLGGTVIKYMEGELGFIGLRKYLNNNRARHPKVFFDRYTEDHFRLRDMLIRNMLSLPNSDALLKQMRLRRYVIHTGRIKMEDKDHLRKRGLRSPDQLDDLVMITTDIPVDGFMDVPEKQNTGHKTWEQQALENGAQRGARLGPTFVADPKKTPRNRFGLPSKRQSGLFGHH